MWHLMETLQAEQLWLQRSPQTFPSRDHLTHLERNRGTTGPSLGKRSFALDIIPFLVDVAQLRKVTLVLVIGHADNTFVQGPLQAVIKSVPDF